MDDPLSPPVEDPTDLDVYALAAVVYAARPDGRILLLKRAEGSSMAGQYFLPGGLVDPGENPWAAAVRELNEETGLVPKDGRLAMVGCYPMFMYGQQMLQLSFACSVQPDVQISEEHTDSVWIRPTEMVDLLSPDMRLEIAGDNEDLAELLESVAVDLSRYVDLVAL